MTETLSAGPAYTLLEDVVYALPPRVVRIVVASGTISTSVNGSDWQTITLDSNDEFVTAAQIIRSTGDDGEVSVRYE